MDHFCRRAYNSMLKNVRVGLADNGHIHLPEAVVSHIPNASDPISVEFTTKLFTFQVSYSVIEYIYPNWKDEKPTDTAH